MFNNIPSIQLRDNLKTKDLSTSCTGSTSLVLFKQTNNGWNWEGLSAKIINYAIQHSQVMGIFYASPEVMGAAELSDLAFWSVAIRRSHLFAVPNRVFPCNRSGKTMKTKRSRLGFVFSHSHLKERIKVNSFGNNTALTKRMHLEPSRMHYIGQECGNMKLAEPNTERVRASLHVHESVYCSTIWGNITWSTCGIL